MEQLTVRWHGHACFSLTCRDFTVVLDPYEDHYVPGFPPLRLTGDLVLCSHQHNDHNAAEIVTLRTGRPNPFRITKIPTFHDPEGGRLRGENTIHLLEVGKLRVAHFGDLGCPLSPAQKAELQGLDAAMVPVGGFYTIGPQEAKALRGVRSELLTSMRKVTRLTGYWIPFLGVLLFLEALFLRGDPVQDAVVATSAGLLGMLPKGLVLLTSVSLAAGIIALSRSGTSPSP